MVQNPVLKFRQSSFISEKPGYLFEKLKVWRAPTTIFILIGDFNIEESDTTIKDF